MNNDIKCETYIWEQPAKSFLELLVAEILHARTKQEADEILRGWIKANDLHPERVKFVKNTAMIE